MLCNSGNDGTRQNSTCISELLLVGTAMIRCKDTQALCELQGAVTHDTDEIEELREQLEVILLNKMIASCTDMHGTCVWMCAVATNAHGAPFDSGLQSMPYIQAVDARL